MKKMTKAIHCVLVAGVVAVGSLAMATPAFAGNSGNTGFVFNMPKTGDTYGTGWRGKWDSTPTFIWAQYLSAPCRVYVDGSSNNGASSVNCTVNGCGYLNYAGSFVIHNNVHEWGYSQARLTAWAANNPSYVSGEWSPDSYGSYQAINAGY